MPLVKYLQRAGQWAFFYFEEEIPLRSTAALALIKGADILPTRTILTV